MCLLVEETVSNSDYTRCKNKGSSYLFIYPSYYEQGSSDGSVLHSTSFSDTTRSFGEVVNF